MYSYSFRRFSSENTQAEEEEVINYAGMDYYQLLEVSPSADDKKLKMAYLKLAKKYHPDIYKGVNKDHFK